jgi:ABC1 atypical kinase-like domain
MTAHRFSSSMRSISLSSFLVARCWSILLLLLVVVTLLSSSSSSSSSSSCRAETHPHPHPPAASSSTCTSSLATAPVGKHSYSPLALERALYIRGVLTQRLSYVGSGQRLHDFTKWVQQNGGEAQVWSMHGRTTGKSGDNNEVAATTASSRNKKRNSGDGLWLFGGNNNVHDDDPFPVDRMNLDIVATSLEAPPSQFPLHHPQQYLLDDDAGSPSVISLLLRAIRLSMHFAPVLTTSGLAMVSPRFRRHVWYRWLASCIGSAGAAWIKWGQWSSTRSDMFPEALCDELARLHNDAPMHSFAISQLAVESSLGLAPGTLRQVFDQFDEVPLASGSIAQVHKAILDGTTLVAVKIRHARVAQLMACDFRLMRCVASLLESCVPMTKWLHLTASVNQFSHTMAQQGDLHVEAHHLEVLNYNFRNWQSVRFPKPFYASSSVIIETFEPGRIVTDLLDTYDAWAALMNLENTNGHNNNNNNNNNNEATVSTMAHDDDASTTTAVTSTTALVSQQPQQQQSHQQSLISGNELIPMDICKFLVVTGINIYLKMLLVDNLMHADLHPGTCYMCARVCEEE